MSPPETQLRQGGSEEGKNFLLLPGKSLSSFPPSSVSQEQQQQKRHQYCPRKMGPRSHLFPSHRCWLWFLAGLMVGVIVHALDVCDQQQPEITAAKVHEALLNLASQGHLNTTLYTGHRSAGFIWTDSYKAMSRDEADGIPPQYLLTDSIDGLYTRAAFRLFYGQSSDLNNSQDEFLTSQSILTVAERGTTEEDQCLFTTGGCPAATGQLCESVSTTRVNMTIKWPIRAVFKIQPLAKHLPFTYVSIDDYTGVPSTECGAQDPSYDGVTCANPLSNCNGMYECDGTSFIDEAQVNATLLDNCGANSDPWTEWDSEINQGDCSTACCNSEGSWHQRWGYGPPTRVYSLSTAELMTDALTVTVTAQNGTVYTLTTTDLSAGTWTVSTAGAGSRFIRLGIARNYALPVSSIAALQGGRIIVWGEPGTAPTQPCLVPTATECGTGGGWAYLDPSIAHTWSTAANGYSIQPKGSVSQALGFGLPENCLNNFYSEYQNVPGWYVDPADPTHPYSYSPCQMSNALNELAADYRANPSAYENSTVCSTLAMRHSIFLPPQYSLQLPNYVLDEEAGTLTRTLNTPGCGQSELACTEVYVDISTAVMRYLSASNSAGIVQQESGCSFNFFGQLNLNNATTPSPSPTPTTAARGYGVVVVTVQNVVDSTTNFRLHTDCSVVGTAAWQALAVSPNDFLLPVMNRSQATSQPMRFMLTPTGMNASIHDQFNVSCTVSVSDESDQVVITQTTLQCYNMTVQVQALSSNVSEKNVPIPCDGLFDLTCTAHDNADYKTKFWLAWSAIAIAVGIVVIILLVWAAKACSSRNGGKKPEKYGAVKDND